jgi:hypothetical protein
MFRSVNLATAAWPQNAISSKPLVPAQQSWAVDATDTLFAAGGLNSA